MLFHRYNRLAWTAVSCPHNLWLYSSSQFHSYNHMQLTSHNCSQPEKHENANKFGPFGNGHYGFAHHCLPLSMVRIIIFPLSNTNFVTKSPSFSFTSNQVLLSVSTTVYAFLFFLRLIGLVGCVVKKQIRAVRSKKFQSTGAIFNPIRQLQLLASLP